MEHSPFLKKIATYQSVSEKAKLIRGDPPKIDFKKKGESPKNEILKYYRNRLCSRTCSQTQKSHFVFEVKKKHKK